MKALNIYQINIIQTLKFMRKTKYGTRKTTGFKFLRVNCREINQVTSKYQIAFLDNTSKKRSKIRKSEHQHRTLHI